MRIILGLGDAITSSAKFSLQGFTNIILDILDTLLGLRSPAQLRFLLSRDHTDCLHSQDLGVNEALQDIATLLQDSGRRLSDFGLPEPVTHSHEVTQEIDAFTPHC